MNKQASYLISTAAVLFSIAAGWILGSATTTVTSAHYTEREMRAFLKDLMESCNYDTLERNPSEELILSRAASLGKRHKDAWGRRFEFKSNGNGTFTISSCGNPQIMSLDSRLSHSIFIVFDPTL